MLLRLDVWPKKILKKINGFRILEHFFGPHYHVWTHILLVDIETNKDTFATITLTVKIST